MSMQSPVLLITILVTVVGCGVEPPLADQQAGNAVVIRSAENVLTTATPAETAIGDDWPYWGGPSRTLISPETNLSTTWPTGGLKPDWTREIGIGFSSMSVSGDQLFAMGHASGNETVWCLNASTGEVIWTHEYPCQLIDNLHEGGPCSTPTIDSDRVYSLGKEGQLFCLSKADGKVIWKQELQPLLGVKLPEWGFSSSGLILGDQLILEAGRVVAFHKMTGEILWQTDIHEAGYGSVAVFEKEGQQLLASLDCDGLRVLSAADGKEIGYFEWKSPYRTNSTTPIILDEGIFISTGYNIGCALLKLEGSELTPIYRSKNMKNHFNNSVLSGGYLYGFDGDSHNGRTVTLNCVDAKTGEVRWKQRGLGCGSLLIADSRLVILSESGDLILADAKPDEYKELARSPLLEGRCWTVPCISGGRLFARNAAGLLKCVSLPRGND